MWPFSKKKKAVKKYRILEKKYSDGDVRYFPQRGDWWNGWRCFSDNSTFKGWDEPKGWLSYKTFAEAETKLKRIIKADQEIDAGARQAPRTHVWAVSTKAHLVEA